MQESPENQPVADDVETSPGFVARNIRLIKLAVLALAVLIPLVIALAFVFGGSGGKSDKKPATPKVAKEAKASKAAAEPAKSPTKEELEAAAREAEQKRLAMQEAHARILAEGKPVSAPQPAKPALASVSVQAAASQPAPAALVTKAPPPPAAEQAATASASAPTPLGRLGYGVSKENVEGLSTLIEAMNKAEAAKSKPRK